MNTTINERIGVLINTLKMNPNSFAKSINRGYTSVDSILKGNTKPSFDFLESVLSAHPAVSPAWLLTGEGEVIIKEATVVVASATDEYLKEHLQMLEQNFARLASQLESKDKQIEGLQRTVDALIARPATPAAAGNFKMPATHEAGIILPLHKETALLVA